MRIRVLAVTVAWAGALATLPAGAYADSVATNGGATDVTSSSAVLHGVVNTADPDSAWTFQYGTSTSYGKVTTVKAIGSGSFAVSATITGLSPNATYHFRLVVIEGSYGGSVHNGDDRTFTTSSSGGGGGGSAGGGGGGGGTSHRFGHTSLRSHSLTVHNGVVSIPLRCLGARGATCKGKFSLRTRGKRTIACASGRFSVPAGQTRVLRPRISGACAAGLKSARGHTLRATLKATFSTHQSALNAPVTLHG